MAINPFAEAVASIIETGGEALRTCYQCGLCTATCPWNLVREFLVRKIIHTGQIGLLLEVGDEENWLCATCGACVARCPRGVEIIDIWRAIRRVAIENNAAPKALRTVLSGIKAQGNPWNDTRDNRERWAVDLGIDSALAAEHFELVYFPCCTPIYDQKVRRIATSTVSLLKKAGVEFALLGAAESCCGESVRKLGSEDLFQGLARGNIKAFEKRGVKKILVSSPHCYHTFVYEYPELGGTFEVLHSSQFFLQLIEEGRLKINKPYPKKVVYHDPCYLGRHNGIYDEPRKILSSIPELELLELPDNREDAICCGGGGGRIWMETKKEERLSNLRVDQALKMNTEVLALACPYCMLNFDDSVLAMGKGDVLEVRDLTEILDSVAGEGHHG
jgi:Fe-S oxidoreductase